jgi:hypothetical protein
LSRQRCSEPEDERGTVVQCARITAALIAILALRAAFSNWGHVSRLPIATTWILIPLALGAALMLREAGRGLVSQLPRPRWSPRFAAVWAGSSGVLFAALLASGSSLGSGSWISITLAVCLGLVLAASLPGARRLLWSLARLHRRIPVRIRTPDVPIPCAATLSAPVRAPLLAGWSDRGPPPQLS